MEKNEEYKDIIKKHSPKSRVLHNTLLAFIGGGGICAAGEALAHLYSYLGSGSLPGEGS